MQRILMLIEQTSNYDKDNRYMAISDINNELENDVNLSSDIESRVCNAILKRLDDTSNDVQSIAVKCLANLVKKVHETQVFEICDKLCSLILSGKSELRDIYSIGLKAAISDMPATTGKTVANRLCGRLVGGVNNDSISDGDDQSIKVECLDILSDILKRFGQTMAAEHANISKTVLAQLGNSRPVVRKRATACMGHLACVVPDALLQRIIKQLLDQIEVAQGQNQSQSNPAGVPSTRTIIQVVGTISRMVGYRLGSQLDRIFPLVLASLKDPDDESMHAEQADELRENILHAIESFVMRCPREVKRHLDDAVSVSTKFLVYDPNYNYDTDEEEMDEQESEDDEDYGDYDDDDDDYDDDDTSWKVRRASIKVLKSIVITHCKGGDSGFLETMSKQSGPLLLSRFKEREESVKVDIIDCFKALIQAVASTQKKTKSAQFVDGGNQMELSDSDSLTAESASRKQMTEQVPTIIKVSVAMLKRTDKKSTKAKQATVSMLKELTALATLDEHLPVLLPYMTEACSKSSSSKESALKFEALLFIREILQRHDYSFTQPLLKDICPAVLRCIEDDWYKVVAEGLRTIEDMVVVMRPGYQKGYDYSAFVVPCYNAILPRLEANDIDQEIKESAIVAVGILFSYLGDELEQELAGVLKLVQGKLANQITRLPALKALRCMAESPLKLDLHGFSSVLCEELYRFLRQQSRTLKQQTLETLDALVRSSGSSISADLFQQILKEASNLIHEADLHLSQLALNLCVSIIRVCPASIPTLKTDTMPMVILLLQSPLLQEGSTLDSTLALFKELASCNDPQMTYEELVSMLMEPIESRDNKMDTGENESSRHTSMKSVLSSISMCLATVCVESKDEGKRTSTINSLVTEIGKLQESNNSGDNAVITKLHLLLLTLGQIGRVIDLSKVNARAYEVIMHTFSDVETEGKFSAEETMTTAAMALGNITVGCMETYLPLLFKALHEKAAGGLAASERHQYVLLRAMLEIISSFSLDGEVLTKQHTLEVQSMLPVLEENCEHKEEGVRNMVAECFGKLALINGATMIPYLANKTNADASPLMRWTLANSLKYMAIGHVNTGLLRDNIEPFLKLCEDEDLQVRRTALLAINSLAHHHPSVILPYASALGSILYNEMGVKAELMRKVDLGPFKHTIDDGLPLRKASFACMSTFIDTIPHEVNVVDFLPYLSKGLCDVDDVQMMCHQIVSQLCSWAPVIVLANVSALLNPLTTAVNKTAKEKKNTDVDRTNDVIRSAVRALFSIAAIPEASQEPSIQDLCDRVLAKPHIAAMVEAENLIKKR